MYSLNSIAAQMQEKIQALLPNNLTINVVPISSVFSYDTRADFMQNKSTLNGSLTFYSATQVPVKNVEIYNASARFSVGVAAAYQEVVLNALSQYAASNNQTQFKDGDYSIGMGFDQPDISMRDQVAGMGDSVIISFEAAYLIQKSVVTFTDITVQMSADGRNFYDMPVISVTPSINTQLITTPKSGDYAVSSTDQSKTVTMSFTLVYDRSNAVIRALAAAAFAKNQRMTVSVKYNDGVVQISEECLVASVLFAIEPGQVGSMQVDVTYKGD